MQNRHKRQKLVSKGTLGVHRHAHGSPELRRRVQRTPTLRHTEYKGQPGQFGFGGRVGRLACQILLANSFFAFPDLLDFLSQPG